MEASGGIWEEWKWGHLISNCALLLNRDFLHCVSPELENLRGQKKKREGLPRCCWGPYSRHKSAFLEVLVQAGPFLSKTGNQILSPGGFQLVCTSEKSFLSPAVHALQRIFFQPKKLFYNQRSLSLVVGHQRKFGGDWGIMWVPRIYFECRLATLASPLKDILISELGESLI